MKKLVSYLIVSFLIFSSVFSVCAKSALLYDGVYGDVNGDNKLNIRDATAMQYKLTNRPNRFKRDPAYLIGNNLADFNGDWKFDIRDVTDLQKMLADSDYNYNHPYAITKGEIPTDAVEIDANIESAKTFFKSPEIPDGYEEGLSFKFITSVEEYEKFFGRKIDEKYDNEFFIDNSLLCIFFKYCEDPFDDFGVSNSFVKDNTLYLKMHYKMNDMMRDFYFQFSQNIPVDKNVLKNINEICLDIED